MNALPVEIARSMGAEYVIASNIIPTPARRKTGGEGRKETFEYKASHRFHEKLHDFIEHLKKTLPISDEDLDEDLPDMFTALTQATYAAEYKTVQAKLKQADMVITSNTQDIAVLDFWKAEKAIADGYAAAKEILKGVNI